MCVCECVRNREVANLHSVAPTIAHNLHQDQDDDELCLLLPCLFSVECVQRGALGSRVSGFPAGVDCSQGGRSRSRR